MNTKHWDDYARAKQRGRYPSEELVRFISSHYGLAKNKSKFHMLEIGCGSGANLWYLAREGYTAHGLDVSKAALKESVHFLLSHGLRAFLCTGDASQMTFPSNFFDCVIDVECLYANDKTKAEEIILSVRRILKPGGYFFSQTFMDGTVFSPKDEAFHKKSGGVRLMKEKDILPLYGMFQKVEYDYATRSIGNRTGLIKEWTIKCRD